MEYNTTLNRSVSSRNRAVEFVKNYNDNIIGAYKTKATAFIHSFGCQQNVADGQTLEGLALEMGYTLVDNAEDANLVLFNTCAVRENAENRVFGNIGQLKKTREQRKDMIIGVCGCMVQQKHIMNQIRTDYPFVDLVFGAGAMDTLPILLEEYLSTGKSVYNLLDPTAEIIENLPVHREKDIKAYLPIITGCNNFCSYCVVPFVRGRERSREPEVIINQAKQLIGDGYKEITLLGQNVNSYGNDLPDKPSFAWLLAEIANIPGEFRVRFMTSHPKDLSTKLIDTIAKYDNICKHIHLPVQSGSDRILSAMNRKYTREHYLDIVDYARKTIPNVNFTSDIIVAFPGETAEDFEQTLSLVEYVEYSSLFTFAYSPRVGTKAADMKQTITQEEKNDRFERLIKANRANANKYHKNLIGTVQKVLVDGIYEKEEGHILGRTDGNSIVIFEGSPDLIGDFINVRITDYYDWAVRGIKTN